MPVFWALNLGDGLRGAHPRPFTPHAWGNLLAQAGWTPTYNGCTETTMATVTTDGSNHISAMSYDASGNALGDGINSYTWDGEAS